MRVPLSWLREYAPLAGSVPAAVSRVATSAADTESASGAYSRSQDSGTRIRRPPPAPG